MIHYIYLYFLKALCPNTLEPLSQFCRDDCLTKQQRKICHLYSSVLQVSDAEIISLHCDAAFRPGRVHTYVMPYIYHMILNHYIMSVCCSWDLRSWRKRRLGDDIVLSGLLKRLLSARARCFLRSVWPNRRLQTQAGGWRMHYMHFFHIKQFAVELEKPFQDSRALLANNPI